MIDQQARAEDLAWLADTGESLTGAARRLGMSADAIEKWARKYGYLELYRRLVAREPMSLADRRAVGRRNAERRWSA